MSAKRNGDETRSGSGKPRETPPTTRIVIVTAAAVALAVVIGWKWATLVIAPAPLIYYLVRPPRDKQIDRLALRWAASLLLLLLASAAFVGPRLSQSVLAGAGVYEQTLSWLAGAGSPPLGAGTVIIVFVAFVVAVVAAGAAAGSAVVAVAIGTAAVSGAVICSSGYNLLQIAVVAISPWQWALLAGLTLILVAASAEPIAPAEAPRRIRALVSDRRVLAGAALVAVALLLRVTVEPWYTALVHNWTIH